MEENEDFKNGEKIEDEEEALPPRKELRPGEPDQDEYETYEDYHEAMIDWKLDKKAGERQQGAGPGPPPPMSRHMVAALSGTEADKARLIKLDEAEGNAKKFQDEAAKAEADGNLKSAAEYTQRAQVWAKTFYDLAMPAYEHEEMKDEMLDIAVHKDVLKNPSQYSQATLNNINAKSLGRDFIIKVGETNYGVTLPEGRTASGVFNAITNFGDNLDPGDQIRRLKAMGLNVPVVEEEVSQEEYEKSRPQPEHSSAFDGAKFKK